MYFFIRCKIPAFPWFPSMKVCFMVQTVLCRLPGSCYNIDHCVSSSGGSEHCRRVSINSVPQIDMEYIMCFCSLLWKSMSQGFKQKTSFLFSILPFWQTLSWRSNNRQNVLVIEWNEALLSKYCLAWFDRHCLIFQPVD